MICKRRKWTQYMVSLSRAFNNFSNWALPAFAYTHCKSFTTGHPVTRPSPSCHFHHMAVGVIFLKLQTDHVTSLFGNLPRNHSGQIMWSLFPLSTLHVVHCMPILPAKLFKGQHSNPKGPANCLAYNRQLKSLMERKRTQIRDHLIFKGKEIKLSVCVNIQKVSKSFGK